MKDIYFKGVTAKGKKVKGYYSNTKGHRILKTEYVNGVPHRSSILIEEDSLGTYLGFNRFLRG